MERRLIDLDEILGPKLSRRLPRFVKSFLKARLHVEELNDCILHAEHPVGVGFFDEALKYLDITYTVRGGENLDPSRRSLFAGNHPLGGPEALIAGSVLKNFYGDQLRVPVNSILGYMHPLEEFFVPISIYGKQNRSAAAKLGEMFSSPYQVLIYPAGRCAQRIEGHVTEQPWKKAFITQARRYQRDIIPMHMSGHNSELYYFWSRVSRFLKLKFNIGMIMLVDELFKQEHNHFVITFGKPIPWQTFDNSKSDQEWADWVKDKFLQLQEGNGCEPNI